MDSFSVDADSGAIEAYAPLYLIESKNHFAFRTFRIGCMGKP